MNSSHSLSPITLSPNTSQVGTVDVVWLSAQYQRELNIDISRFVHNLDEITVMECRDTGYRYYEPFSTAGDASFYEELEAFPWYYMDWKWEHEIAARNILPAKIVLEIGCGRGGFLEKLHNPCTGLELNEQAATEARRRGLNVLTETIEAHAETHVASYDVVCSFQVLEHIVKVNEFIQACAAVLRPGGLMIASVPNNDSFIFREFAPILNFPPHHMGLWSPNALLALQMITDIRPISLFLEPLQPYHLGYGTDYVNRHLSGSRDRIIAGAAAKFERIFLGELPPLQRLAQVSASALAPYLPGHSMLIVFRKP
jgi:2-polyprenyl-3-methyl-5-hydroxy-6-metoxy-1,4-benzoquinol methylase